MEQAASGVVQPSDADDGLDDLRREDEVLVQALLPRGCRQNVPGQCHLAVPEDAREAHDAGQLEEARHLEVWQALPPSGRLRDVARDVRRGDRQVQEEGCGQVPPGNAAEVHDDLLVSLVARQEAEKQVQNPEYRSGPRHDRRPPLEGHVPGQLVGDHHRVPEEQSDAQGGEEGRNPGVRVEGEPWRPLGGPGQRPDILDARVRHAAGAAPQLPELIARPEHAVLLHGRARGGHHRGRAADRRGPGAPGHGSGGDRGHGRRAAELESHVVDLDRQRRRPRSRGPRSWLGAHAASQVLAELLVDAPDNGLHRLLAGGDGVELLTKPLEPPKDLLQGAAVRLAAASRHPQPSTGEASRTLRPEGSMQAHEEVEPSGQPT
mmetsp:Transcript_106947/g.333356  ORF Transcript_106947/g.333356 Transcript_106947/m.333356 type:complete len:377 (-) Transcript_106947:9-1139(-)